jgi:hypothetical protein
MPVLRRFFCRLADYRPAQLKLVIWPALSEAGIKLASWPMSHGLV